MESQFDIGSHLDGCIFRRPEKIRMFFDASSNRHIAFYIAFTAYAKLPSRRFSNQLSCFHRYTVGYTNTVSKYKYLEWLSANMALRFTSDVEPDIYIRQFYDRKAKKFSPRGGI